MKDEHRIHVERGPVHFTTASLADTRINIGDRVRIQGTPSHEFNIECEVTLTESGKTLLEHIFNSESTVIKLVYVKGHHPTHPPDTIKMEDGLYVFDRLEVDSEGCFVALYNEQ